MTETVRLSELRARFTPLAQSFVPVEDIAMGLLFDCPCEACKLRPKRQRLWVAFANPIDHGRLSDTGWQPPSPAWHRTGDTIENITLDPSIDFSKSGHWHGHIIAGKVLTA